MCGITGYIVKDKSKTTDVFDKWLKIFCESEHRGVDGFGLYGIADGIDTCYKHNGCPSNNINVLQHYRNKGFTTLIASNRAEPTTEFIQNKNDNDNHPFADVYEQKVWVVENGVVSNDKELIEKYGKGTSNIDASVIPNVIYKEWDGKLGSLVTISNIIKGGNAILGYDKRYNSTFIISTFKPLYIAVSEDAYYFSSLKQTFKCIWNYHDRIKHRIAIEKIKPYSINIIDEHNNLYRTSIRNNVVSNKVLVICSGGLDSTTVATYYKQKGYNVTLLNILYGCKAELKEIESIKKIAEVLNVDIKFIDLKPIYNSITNGCKLLDNNEHIINTNDGISGAEYSYEWVWARNLLFYSVAIAIAECDGYSIVASGINLEESGAYSDNEEEFIIKLRELLPNAIDSKSNIKLKAPLVNLVKHEIVKMGLQLNVPYEHTWSCYLGNDKHCGKCGPCFMRKMAFQINNENDPVFK